MPTGVFTTDKTLSDYAASVGKGRFIADMICPPMYVPTQTFKISLIDSHAEAYRNVDDRRAAGAPPLPLDINVSRPTSFTCEDHAREAPISAPILADDVAAIRTEMTYVDRLVEAVLTRKESVFLTKIAAILDSGSDATGDLTTTPSVKWDNASGKPITDMLGYISNFEVRGQRSPNYVAMSAKVLRKIAMNAEFLSLRSDSVDKNSGLDALASVLANLLGVDNVYVARTGKNTAGSGATPTFSDQWDEQVLIGYQEPPSILCGAGMVQCVWNNPQSAMTEGRGGLVNGWTVFRYPDPRTRTQFIQVSQFYDFGSPFTSSTTENALTPLYYVSNTLT